MTPGTHLQHFLSSAIWSCNSGVKNTSCLGWGGGACPASIKTATVLGILVYTCELSFPTAETVGADFETSLDYVTLPFLQMN